MATFLRGLFYGDSWYSQIPKDIFMRNYQLIGKTLVNKPTNVVKVACLKEDQDVILGYSILSDDFSTIHFVFVKKAWRKQGIGRSLVPQLATAATHLTQLGKLLLPKLPTCVFDPFHHQ